MWWSGHNSQVEGTQGSNIVVTMIILKMCIFTGTVLFLSVKNVENFNKCLFCLDPCVFCRYTLFSFWTSLALALALDHGTLPREFRRWTMDSSRFFLSYSKQNSKGQQYQYNEYCDYFHHLPGDWIDNVSTSTSASWRHRPLLCSVQVWLSKKIDHKNSKKNCQNRKNENRKKIDASGRQGWWPPGQSQFKLTGRQFAWIPAPLRSPILTRYRLETFWIEISHLNNV